jgi:SPP1 gp7 family putative phage head morphogenesis protein
MIFDKIIAFFNKQKPTKPFIDIEVATDDEAIYRRYGLTPWFEDELIQAKQLKLYRKMMTDAEIYSCINTLKTIRLSTGWEIQPASDNPKDVELRDFVDYNLSNLECSFDDDLREIMGALEYGVSINELVWRVEDKGRYKGKIIIGNIKQKNPDKYNVQADDFGNIRPDGIINISPYDYGKKYPVEKFLVYSFNKEFENVWGKSVLRSLYELWMLKQTLIKAWGVYLEKFGMPLTKAKVPFNYFQNYEMIKQIKNVLNQFRMETNIIVPDNVEIEIMKNDNTGGSPFDRAIEAINEQIRRTILGQTLTGNAGSSSYALGKVHFDILLFYVEQLGKDVAEKVINNQLIKRLIDYNFANVDYYPKFAFKPLVQDDIVQIIDKYYAGVQNGVLKPIPEDENKIRTWLKLPEREINENQNQGNTIEQDGADVNLIGFAEKNKIFTGVRRRTFTKYEEKVNFVDIRNIIENQTSILTIDLAKIIEESLEDLYKQVEKKKIIDEKNLKAIDDLNLKYLGDIKSKFYDMLVRVYEQSHRIGKQILSQKKKELKFQSIDFRKMTPKEVMDFFKQKSYFMTQVERDNIFKIIKPILFNIIKSGGTIKDFIQQANEKFDYYIKQGEIDEEERYSSSRLETIVRTNVNEALNYGLRMYYEDPELDGFVEAYQYSAIMDDRVRPNHAILDGSVFSASNPVVDKITPPLGYNCRCVLIPVVQGEQWKEDELPANWSPDPGFEK